MREVIVSKQVESHNNYNLEALLQEVEKK